MSKRGRASASIAEICVDVVGPDRVMQTVT